jgi:hypothetical protein
MRKELLLFTAKNISKPSSVHFLNENLATHHFCMLFKKGRLLNKVMNRKINGLLQAGIITKFETERNEPTKRVIKQNLEEAVGSQAQVLTMDHLGLCFVIIAICWGLCCVVFAIECLVGFFLRF